MTGAQQGYTWGTEGQNGAQEGQKGEKWGIVAPSQQNGVEAVYEGHGVSKEGESEGATVSS